MAQIIPMIRNAAQIGFQALCSSRLSGFEEVSVDEVSEPSVVTRPSTEKGRLHISSQSQQVIL